MAASRDCVTRLIFFKDYTIEWVLFIWALSVFIFLSSLLLLFSVRYCTSFMVIKYRFSSVSDALKKYSSRDSVPSTVFLIFYWTLFQEFYRLSYCLWIVSSRSSFLASLQLVGNALLQNVGINLNDDFAKRLRKKKIIKKRKKLKVFLTGSSLLAWTYSSVKPNPHAIVSLNLRVVKLTKRFDNYHYHYQNTNFSTFAQSDLSSS